MRCRLALAVVAAFVGGSSIAAYAQAPAVVTRGGGGTGIGTGAGKSDQPAAGTGGTASRGGNATGGITIETHPGTGGIGDVDRRAAHTGGVKD